MFVTRVTRIFVIDSHDWNRIRLCILEQPRMLLATGNAPRAPKIQQPNLALHVTSRKHLLRIMKLRQLESRRSFVDKRRRNLARIVAQSNEQKDDEPEEQRQRNEEKLFHC